MKKPILEIKNLSGYYKKICALKNSNLTLFEGESIVFTGLNGAGKSSLIKSIIGYEIENKGEIYFRGKLISKLPTHERVKMGIGYVAEGRNLFKNLTVKENIELISKKESRFIEYFPNLKCKMNSKAKFLSGGEQQMLAIYMALLLEPKLLLLDEPSMGLAPVIARNVYKIIKKLKEQNVSLLIVEQKFFFAKDVADKFLNMVNGTILQNK